MKNSLLTLIFKGLNKNSKWEKYWTKSELKKNYEIIVVGGGGHGLATILVVVIVVGILKWLGLIICGMMPQNFTNFL